MFSGDPSVMKHSFRPIVAHIDVLQFWKERHSFADISNEQNKEQKV